LATPLPCQSGAESVLSFVQQTVSESIATISVRFISSRIFLFLNASKHENKKLFS
jgi:hypothetical protein